MMGTNAQAAIPQLQAAIRSPGLYPPGIAAFALANSGQDPETWMPVILELIRDKNSGRRIVTIKYLGLIGNKARAAVPIIITALTDNEELVREAAAEALKKIDPEAAAKAGVK